MIKNNKNGITLIALVITIVVMLIIAGVAISMLNNDGILAKAKKAAFLNDLKNFQTELRLYESNQFAENMGSYDASKLQANETSVTYNGVVDNTKTIFDIIPSLKNNTKYYGKFIVIDGKLVFQGPDTSEQKWAEESGIVVLYIGEPIVSISAPSTTGVSPGTNVTYTIQFSSGVAIKTVDLNNKIEITNESGVGLVTQPNITVGTVSGTSSDLIRQVDVTINTSTLTKGNYKIKVKPGAVTNLNDSVNSADTISDTAFNITNNPVIVANQTNWTNGNVTITINYFENPVLKEYSLDGTTWQTYTSQLVISNNGTTISARSKDSLGNQTGTTTLTVSNIDKIAPTVTLGNPSSLNISPLQSVTIPMTITENGSGIDETTINSTNITVEKVGITSANVQVDGSGNNRTITVNNIVGEGSFTVKINNLKDTLGNTLAAAVISQQVNVAIPIYRVANSSITANSNKTAYGTSSPQKMFDGNTSSDYQNYGCYIYQITFPLHINFILDSPRKIYKMRYYTYGNGAYQPIDFTIQGSNDTTNGSDGTWTTIKTITNLTILPANSWGEFIVGSNTAYKAYKMNITKIYNNDNQFLYNEMELYEY